MGAWLMGGFAVSLLSPCGPFPADPNHRVGLTAWGSLTTISLPPSPQRTASPCNLFQWLWLPWSVDLVGEHAPP